ncbi:sulfatase-like hydrolase/transferase [Hyunsoonleella sp. SJ7]|uniref:Sulfatase-like hydrolase/transferase n=1 Tax=Hyunsoonleella aquatilis TaxID=2762758 RepID=A0A923HE37_9FLAO|nr:phosphoethanolamine transferase [Hyunsoonleella aquatilis]MBC3758518.1 sulfatase-like hydrolase/transferase [Hyunsoonleella aquatilis]
MKLLFSKYKRNIVFHLVLNVLFAVCISLSSYYHIPLRAFEGKLMYFIHLCVLQSSFAGVLYFLSLSRLVFKVVFSLLFLVLGLTAFWGYSINMSMSYAVFEATFGTKLYIVKDLISIQLIAYMLLLIGLLVFILKFYKTIQPKKGRLVFVPLSVLLILLFFWADRKRTHSFRNKLPYSFFYAFGEYYDSDSDIMVLTDPPKISKEEKFNKLNVILVLGESLRSDHLGLNGYERQTTPLLSKRDNVFSFNNISTTKTNTAVSLPCVLTDQSDHTESKDSISPIYSIYNAFDIPTYWIGNQILESSYRPIVKTNDSIFILDEFRSVWSIGKKKDMDLLPKFGDYFKGKAYGLYTLHMIGSHWWYEDKYTSDFRRFTPVVDSKYIPSLTREQMVNSYDNTVLYLDYFLNELIKLVEDKSDNAIVIYISDHGESLGENGKYLHSNIEAVNKPGMIVWVSKKFKESFPEKVESLFYNRNKPYTTDIIYHSLIDLLDTNQLEYDKSLSIFQK